MDCLEEQTFLISKYWITAVIKLILLQNFIFLSKDTVNPFPIPHVKQILSSTLFSLLHQDLHGRFQPLIRNHKLKIYLCLIYAASTLTEFIHDTKP